MTPLRDRGRFITIEGGEGVGKSTNLDFVCGFLADRGVDLIVTREPGGTPLAEQVRKLLLANRHDETVAPLTEALLVFAARSQHLATVIQPALAAGKWVICDRFTDATYAYQGAGRGLDTTVIATLERLVQGGFRPDATLLLDMATEVGLDRARRRGEPDRFEAEEMKFFDRVRSGYLARAAAEPQRFFVIDAAPQLEIVQAALAAALERILASGKG